MPFILNIETATVVCSVALSHDGSLVAIRETEEKNSHSSVLTLLVEEVIKEGGITLKDLDAIAVSEGPGSFTGLRIGVATAKGFCFSLEKPLISVPTLQSMALGMKAFSNQQPATASRQSGDNRMLFCPMIDARRMEVYSALYDEKNELIREVQAVIIDENSFSEFLKDHTIFFAGDGAEKCRSLLEKQPNAIFQQGYKLSASSMIPVSTEKFKTRQFEDVAYFEPAYLKDFVAGKPRVKGLR